MNWSEFFHMGGYALYVWSAYGFAALVLILNWVAAARRRHTVLKMLRDYARATDSDSP